MSSGALAVAALLAAAAVVLLAGRRRVRRRWRQLRLHAPEGTPAIPGGTPGIPGGVARKGRPDPDAGLRDPAMMLELIGAMLDAGSGVGRALELVAGQASPELGRPLVPVVSALAIGADWETAWRGSQAVPDRLLSLRDALAFAALTGVPSSAILYSQAARLRRVQFRTAERRAAALGVKLVVPLGLCSLPAFVCLGIVPVLLAMLPHGS